MKKLSLLCSAALAISMFSCKKNNDSSSPNNGNDGATMTAFMQAHGPRFESFTIDAGAGAVITSSKGIKYTIPGGAFVTQAGVSVTGSVTIAVKEINSAGDMLLADRPTLTGDGRMLVSYGEIFVTAAQNNQNLQLKKDSSVKVQIPAKPINGQEVPMWSGDSSTSLTLSGYDYLNTAVSVTVQTPVRKGIVWDQLSAGYAFFNSANGSLDFRLDSLAKWRNCDAILSNSGSKTTVLGYFNSHFNSATATDYSGDQPTLLFFKPQGQNTLIKFYDIILNATGTHQGFISYQASIPVGMQGTFLAMTTLNGKFYADMKDVTIAAPSGSNNYTTLSFDPQEVSESAMISLILQLNTK
ncbi:MAG: hypothetical protein Q8927_20555 [Bacteroidota bacterium]|nr:hypothetical protein [Bacteroidota bacterium]MDP4218597.1 hypothetical protein [Bacteroidota bacterium]MDP4244871.1 hypothetical protein [Bacteroidota bacterium]MDP4253640.1 hypothetical protein [Bacteroidota bacterium]MDP4260476.1 hypothetical protein [Bacteroidota bacterium]